ncbi:MAG: AzlD domain-containing protein [Desulfotomaculum sp.]|nr:AzlD domain-containing protein [Desulfotomaculum sp.]
MDNLWWIVLAMALVTYIPRLLPLVFLNNIYLPPFVNSFLQFIPFAALGALVFPGILYSTGNIASAIAGSIIAIVLAYLNLNIVIVVIGGILGVVVWEILV